MDEEVCDKLPPSELLIDAFCTEVETVEDAPVEDACPGDEVDRKLLLCEVFVLEEL